MQRTSLLKMCWLPAVLLASPATAQTQGASTTDAWWGSDKALHFGLSALIAGGGYGISSFWLEPRWARASAGAGLAVGAGVVKELADVAGLGQPSWKDLFWDVLGAATGVSVSYAIDRWLWPHPPSAPTKTRGAIPKLSGPFDFTTAVVRG